MFRSAADDLKAEGRKEGRKKGREEGRKEGEVQVRQQVLLLQLRKRFRALPAEVVARVERTTDLAQLDAWLERIVDATTLEDMGLGSGQ
jgi:predicted transposase YdaD